MVLDCFVSAVEFCSNLSVEMLVQVFQHLASSKVFKHVYDWGFLVAKFDFYLFGLVCGKVFNCFFDGLLRLHFIGYNLGGQQLVDNFSDTRVVLRRF